MSCSIHANKNIAAAEYAALMGAVGWGRADDYSPERIQRSLQAYPFVAHARAANGSLVGYVSAFSDQAFSTFVGELVVHPAHQRQGIGRALLAAVEAAFAGVPIYAEALESSQAFWQACGYRLPAAETRVWFKRP